MHLVHGLFYCASIQTILHANGNSNADADTDTDTDVDVFRLLSDIVMSGLHCLGIRCTLYIETPKTSQAGKRDLSPTQHLALLEYAFTTIVTTSPW